MQHESRHLIMFSHNLGMLYDIDLENGASRTMGLPNTPCWGSKTVSER